MTETDVIWVTMESARQDYTSLGAGTRDTTPNLTELGTDGFVFDNCFSHDIWTRSSTASILTGHAPAAHQTWSNEAKLPDEIETIPAAFRDAGYRTVGISPNGQFSLQTGLDRGFDHFHHLTKSTLLPESGVGPFLKWVLNLRRHSGGLTRDGNQHCLGYLCNSIARRHIDDASGDQSLFLYVHRGDSHHAYVPPIAWRDRFASDLPMPVDDAIELALDMSDRLHGYIAAEDPFTDEEWQTLKTLYDTSIAYVDHVTGKLVRYAREQLDDPIVVVTGDHGELFGERRMLAHMLVTNAAVANVPLVVSGLDGRPPDGLVQHADVMQMLCNDLDIDHPVPIGRDIRNEPRQFAVTQRGGQRARNKLDRITAHNDTFPRAEYHEDDLTTLWTENWRFQRSSKGYELFERGDDTTEISEDYPSVKEELDALCDSWQADYGQPVGAVGTAEFDDDTASQLRNLGYM